MSDYIGTRPVSGVLKGRVLNTCSTVIIVVLTVPVTVLVTVPVAVPVVMPVALHIAVPFAVPLCNCSQKAQFIP